MDRSIRYLLLLLVLLSTLETFSTGLLYEYNSGEIIAFETRDGSRGPFVTSYEHCADSSAPLKNETSSKKTTAPTSPHSNCFRMFPNLVRKSWLSAWLCDAIFSSELVAINGYIVFPCS